MNYPSGELSSQLLVLSYLLERGMHEANPAHVALHVANSDSVATRVYPGEGENKVGKEAGGVFLQSHSYPHCQDGDDVGRSFGLPSCCKHDGADEREHRHNCCDCCHAT